LLYWYQTTNTDAEGARLQAAAAAEKAAADVKTAAEKATAEKAAEKVRSLLALLYKSTNTDQNAVFALFCSRFRLLPQRLLQRRLLPQKLLLMPRYLAERERSLIEH
jgi:hypothetical protein